MKTIKFCGAEFDSAAAVLFSLQREFDNQAFVARSKAISNVYKDVSRIIGEARLAIEKAEQPDVEKA